MNTLRTWILFCLLSLLLAPAAHAAIGDLQGVGCEVRDGVEFCGIEIAPGTWIEGPADAWAPHVDGNGFEFDDGVQQLSVRFCDPLAATPENLLTGVCYETIRGTHQFQVPQIGFLGSVVTPEAPLVSVGLDTGENLANDATLELAPDLVSMLDDSNKYMLMLKDTAGFTASIPGIDFLELSAGGDRTAVVVGMNELFLYFEGQLPGLPPKQDEKDDGSDSDSTADSDANDSDANGNDATGSEGADGSDAGADETADSGTETDPAEGSEDEANTEDEPEEEEEEDGGPDAVAIKMDGGIPFTPLRNRGVEVEMIPFDGHIYVKGPVPVATGFEIDGTLVFDIDPDGDGDHPFELPFYQSVDLQIGANGTLQMELPLPGVELVGIPLEFGDATVIGVLSDDRDAFTFSGIVSPDDFMSGLPLVLAPSGTIEGWGHFIAQDPLGSFVHLEGEMGVDGEALGALLGLELGTLQSADAILDVNASGLTLQGSTTSALHPDLAPNGSIGMLVHVGADPSAWLLELSGDLTVAGQGLRNAVVSVGGHGISVQGILRQGESEFLVVGALGPDGLRIEGQVELAPIAANGAERELAALAVTAARLEVERLQSLADDASSAVSVAQASLAQARSALATAQSALASANGSLSYHRGKYDYHSGKYNYWKKKSCKWHDASCKAKRSSKKAYYSAKKSYYWGKVKLYTAAVASAKTAVSGAQATVNSAQSGVDAALAELNALQAQLAGQQALLAAAEAQLESLPRIDAEIALTVHLVLDRGELSGQVEATVEGQALATGTVEFGSPATACVTIPGSSEICQSF